MADSLLLDRFMPEHDFSIVFSRVLRALPADRRPADPAAPRRRSPTSGRGSGPALSRPTFRIRDLSSIGWLELGERPGAELAFGLVGKAWSWRGGAPEPVTPDTFRGFDEPGFSKIVESHARVSVRRAGVRRDRESRILCTDEDSRRRVQRYWLAVTTLTHLMRLIALPSLARKVASASGPAA
jgi:hypothetical protein